MYLLAIAACWALLITTTAFRSNHKCCTPEQLEGLSFALTGAVRGERGEAEVIRERNVIFYDSTNQRLASFTNLSSSFSPRPRRIQLLAIYNGTVGTEYEVDLETKRCTKRLIPGSEFPRACIPDSAKDFGNIRMGAGRDILDAKSYFLQVPPELEQYIDVTPELCVPVATTLVGRIEGRHFMQTKGFSDIKTHLSRPDVFDIPASCQGVHFSSVQKKASMTIF